MYKKVSTDLKFVDREKETEKFWEENHIFEKSMENRKRERPIHSMMDLRQQMVNRISVMY